MKKTSGGLISTLILFCLFLFFAGFPFANFIVDSIIRYWVMGFARIIFLIFFFFLSRRWELPSLRFHFSWADAVYLPFLFLSFSNLLYLAISQKNLTPVGDGEMLLSEAFFSLSVALSEEALFRGLITEELAQKKKMGWAILLSALIFSLSHSVNFFSLPLGEGFAQIGYTFVLGLFLALLYLGSQNFLYAVMLHFLFNFLNNYLYASLYQGEWDILFFLVNGLIGVALLIWGFFLFRALKKKNDLSSLKID